MRRLLKRAYVIGALVALVLQRGETVSYANSVSLKTYVITETGRYASLDPLDADSTMNLPVARMLYLTPLEMGMNDRLQSTVLESFSFSKEKRTATWVVRQGLVFSDGTPITPDDVAFAVARMAYTRPTFPVIKELEGVASWAKSQSALSSLPSGIAVDGQVITLKFTKELDHPLFRFVLEVFSIIPKNSVDIRTNTLLVAKPHISGYYKIAKETDTSIMFERRDVFQKNAHLPVSEKVEFKYTKPSSLLTLELAIDESTVAAANETSFTVEQLRQLESKFSIRSLPKSRFTSVVVNPDVPAFSEKSCRYFFMNTFRENIVSLGLPRDELEGSISSQILPGYLTMDELKKRGSQLSASDEKRCLEIFKKHPVKWAIWEGQRNALYENAIKKTLEMFGQQNGSPEVISDRPKLDDAFVKGELPIAILGSGFWAQDPYGDMQMLFTKNLHKPLVYLASDQTLQSLIEDLRGPALPKKKRDLAEKLNVHIFDQSLLGVFRHTKRFYLTSRSNPLGSVPMALTSPSPWHVFEN